jgi:hypothetical protein
MFVKMEIKYWVMKKIIINVMNIIMNLVLLMFKLLNDFYFYFVFLTNFERIIIEIIVINNIVVNN